jgi:hypothetical protein
MVEMPDLTLVARREDLSREGTRLCNPANDLRHAKCPGHAEYPKHDRKLKVMIIIPGTGIKEKMFNQIHLSSEDFLRHDTLHEH